MQYGSYMSSPVCSSMRHDKLTKNFTIEANYSQFVKTVAQQLGATSILGKLAQVGPALVKDKRDQLITFAGLLLCCQIQEM